LPVVVKPCCGGSSIGVTIARTNEEFKIALDEGFRWEDELVIEEFVKGREFSMGVIEHKALPVIEIAPLQGFYDYKNKYQAGLTEELCPAPLTEAETTLVVELTARGFAALQLNGYARLDFILTPDGTAYCLEANALPGMTPTSLLPQMAAYAGLSYEDLCEYIVSLALKK
ncbi:MAG: ATP-grasp domain-containing protein, partial [Clostridia bacterium]|nr:ATP-grasp domain-containing protein [Clostridia bacterium]